MIIIQRLAPTDRSSTSDASGLDFDRLAPTMTPATCGWQSDDGEHKHQQLGSVNDGTNSLQRKK
jgi:hypothetical protein